MNQTPCKCAWKSFRFWDFFYEKKFQSNKLKIYHQHFFEDTSGLRFHNRYDGLWGLIIESKNNIFLIRIS